VAKFHEATPFGFKVVAANTLHFKTVFDHPMKKNCKGARVPGEVALGAGIWSSEKAF